jgi:phenylacetate-CoA ligase
VIWNPEAETGSPERRAQLQGDRLARVVAWVGTRVPFYAGAFERAGISASPIKDLHDLARLPFTTKQDLRDQYPFGLFAVSRAELIRIHASSGTRGKPTIVGYTRADLDVWREVMARSLAAAGAAPGHTIHVAYGYGLFTGGLGVHDGAERMGLTAVPVSSGNTLRQILLLQDLRPHGLACTPSFAVHIGEGMAEQGVDPRTLGIMYGLFGAEPWSEGMRHQIETRWGLTAVDCYGLSEVIGPGVAVECAEVRQGLHINEDHFLPEIVDPVTGEPQPPQREGELVLTCLTKEALPLIRYRTGDITSLDPGPCRCGRTTVRMARIKGRSDDMLIIKGVNVYPSQIEACLLTLDELAPHYQVVVDRQREFPTLELHIEPTERLAREWGAFAPDRPEVRALADRAAERLRGYLGLQLPVTVVHPKTIARSEGKAVRVVERKGD